ncbi:uncharacterized protein LOC142319607 isoform X2 [Lycorma delicatula]|uniref:uncharacterized protein LOC142319607 isoform X2 n=1 Tax=Lycorma delicatula TaxID=130591 RepID=UPI003F515A80
MRGKQNNCLIFLYWLLWYLMISMVPRMQAVNSETKKRCLEGYAREAIPKRHVMYRGDIHPFIMERSERVIHQLITDVFLIFVEEFLGYSDVKLITRKDNFNASETLQRLADETELNNKSYRIPKAMANLELWVPPETNLISLEARKHFKETGTISSPGRFGWFIPTNSKLEKSLEYYTTFQERGKAKLFSVMPDEMNLIMDKSNMKEIFDYESGSFNCSSSSDISNCSEGLFTPPLCEHNNACALLISGNPDETGFVVHHIKSLKLYVKVAWVGKRLEEVIFKMKKLMLSSKSERLFVFLARSPSIVTVPGDEQFKSIAFPPCESYGLITGCKYNLHRLVKVVWQQLLNAAKPIHDSLVKIHFTREDYLNLINRYAHRSQGDSIRNVSCDWIRNNLNTVKDWLPDNDSTDILYIGGIFPVDVKDYRGNGIITAAQMAIESVNKNSTLLQGYKLELLLADGKCRTDLVIKTFMDYVYLNSYNRLVGILGPACSDTVEPLAGVSRYYRTVVISYSAEGSTFSDRTKYPYFFRTIGENRQYTYVYLQLLKKLQWSQVASLTQDGTKYAEYISSLQDLLYTEKIMFIINRKFPADREPDAMNKYLIEMKAKSARIIIADVYNGTLARDTMCQAYRLSMTAAKGYVWFLPLWLTPEWYNTDYYNSAFNESINCSTKEMIQAINGHLGLTFAHYAPDDMIMEENITVGEWKKEYEKRLTEEKNEHSDYGGYAYDAIWTFALALDKLMKVDPSFLSNIQNEKTIKHFVEKVEQTDFYGVSGRVEFSHNRPSRLSVVNVIQWLDNKTHKIGTFFPNSSDPNGGTLYLNESLIKWLTPDGKRPVDGADQCIIQWFSTALDVPCEQAMIILNVSAFFALMLIMMSVFCLIKRQYDRKVRMTNKFWKSRGIDPLNSSNTNDKWEISRDKVVLNRKLGEGAFGFVYGGEACINGKEWVAVAVKTLKIGSTTEEKLDFLSEAEFMKRFDHINIVKLLGVCTKSEPLYTIMEFMLYGDLKTFLLARRHLVNEKVGEESEEVSSKKLTGMALDVARALSYLNELKYVHRDVASRNCLVSGSRVVKLGDFGMTRPMFENDYYKFNRKGMLPVRWMAPESLGLGIFSPASDIWSYGVLLYEIITFGSFPFQGLSNNQVLDHVKNGYTLKIPSKVKPQLEALIRSCWNREPKLRPQASAIVEFLANNPRILSPCLDVPLSSVQIEDTGQLQMHMPDKLRKFSITLRNRSNNSITSQRPQRWKNLSVDDENFIWDQPDSPIETLPPIADSWNNRNADRQSVILTNNDVRINVRDNPINRLWSNDNINNGVVEPLLGSSDNSNNVNNYCNNDSVNKYVPLRPTANGYNDTLQHEILNTT